MCQAKPGVGADPLPQAVPRGGACGLESLAWLHDCPQHRGVAWVADQPWSSRAACRHWPGGRHCGIPRGLLEPPLPSLWTEPRGQPDLCLSQLQGWEGPCLDGSVPCSPGLQMPCPTGSAHSSSSLALPGPAASASTDAGLRAGHEDVPALLRAGAPSPACAHTPKVPGPPNTLQADGIPPPPMPVGCQGVEGRENPTMRTWTSRFGDRPRRAIQPETVSGPCLSRRSWPESAQWVGNASRLADSGAALVLAPGAPSGLLVVSILQQHFFEWNPLSRGFACWKYGHGQSWTT